LEKIKKITNDTVEYNNAVKLINSNGLNFSGDVDFLWGFFCNNKLKGICGYQYNVIKYLVVDVQYQGENISSKLLTSVTNEMFDSGIEDIYVYTGRCNLQKFKNMGFEEVYSTSKTSLLEGGKANISSFLEEIKNSKTYIKNHEGDISSIVMNCNPFTEGHRFLIEKASEENNLVVVFILEEDRSYFSFEERFEMVKKGTYDLSNVLVVPSSKYMISSATFPSYFLKEENLKNEEYMDLDLKIYSKIICPSLKMKTRYVGEEADFNITKKYNKKMKEILEKNGIDVKIVFRKEANGKAISASKVRKSIKENKFEEIKNLVPNTTYEYIKEKLRK